MDAALLLILIAVGARTGAMAGGATRGQPSGRLERLSRRQAHRPRCGVAALWWHGWRDAAGDVPMPARRHVGRGRPRSAWVRALCDVSFVRSRYDR